MKNWDFYGEQVRENPYFAYTKRKIRPCTLTECSECDFFWEDDDCASCRIKFLYQDYKEPIVLTDDEKALCKLLGRGWIARDKNGDLYWHFANPLKTSMYWGSKNAEYIPILPIHTIFPQCKFEFIKWEDEEPWEVPHDYE